MSFEERQSMKRQSMKSKSSDYIQNRFWNTAVFKKSVVAILGYMIIISTQFAYSSPLFESSLSRIPEMQATLSDGAR